MKTLLKIAAAVISLIGAAVLLKLASEILSETSHNYIEVE